MIICSQLSQPALIKSRLVTSQCSRWMTSSTSLPDMLRAPRDHRPRDRCLDGPHQRAVYRRRHGNATSSPGVSIALFSSSLRPQLTLPLLCGPSSVHYAFIALHPVCLSVRPSIYLSLSERLVIVFFKFYFSVFNAHNIPRCDLVRWVDNGGIESEDSGANPGP